LLPRPFAGDARGEARASLRGSDQGQDRRPQLHVRALPRRLQSGDRQSRSRAAIARRPRGAGHLHVLVQPETGGGHAGRPARLRAPPRRGAGLDVPDGRRRRSRASAPPPRLRRSRSAARRRSLQPHRHGPLRQRAASPVGGLPRDVARRRHRQGDPLGRLGGAGAVRRVRHDGDHRPFIPSTFGGIVRGWRGEMHARNATTFIFETLAILLAILGLTTLGACGNSDNHAPSGSDEIPIVAAASADVPYQLGANSYGVAGGAFLAKANMGSSTVVLDATTAGKICRQGTGEMVPTPADGSPPPYSDYWGIDLGFNLNQGADAVKNPWSVPAGVTGFWFTVEGAAIPPIRFKTT